MPPKNTRTRHYVDKKVVEEESRGDNEEEKETDSDKEEKGRVK